MGTYGADNQPTQVRFFTENFDAELVGISALNGGLFMVRDGDVVLHAERGSTPTTNLGGAVDYRLTLGKSSWAEPSGKVRSETKAVSGRSPDNNVANIHAAAREVFEETFDADADSLYEAWVEAFGESSIRSDSRQKQETA